MNKRCTNTKCRKMFSTLESGNVCPHCGKEYPQMKIKCVDLTVTKPAERWSVAARPIIRSFAIQRSGAIVLPPYLSFQTVRNVSKGECSLDDIPLAKALKLQNDLNKAGVETKLSGPHFVSKSAAALQEEHLTWKEQIEKGEKEHLYSAYRLPVDLFPGLF